MDRYRAAGGRPSALGRETSVLDAIDDCRFLTAGKLAVDDARARAAEAALLLLSTGRADMARVVLEGLPALVGEALVSAAAERARATAAAEVARLAAEARDLSTRLARPPRARQRRDGPGPPPA